MNKHETDYADAIDKYLGGIDKVVETHMSKVYLGKSKVVKAFRPIDLFFVDMRPLLKRRASAIKTAQIDGVYSPDLNTRVATVILSNGKYSIVDDVVLEAGRGAGEEVIDYVIVMRRFLAACELSELYRRGEVTKTHAAQIGALLASAHKKAETNDDISRIGFGAICGNFDESFRIAEMYIDISISEEDHKTIFSAYRKFVQLNKEFLLKRRDSGFIRQCHGDAHSGNMFVEDGKVKIFDCIGFKDEFSYMDVVSDLAFACMDAIFHGRGDLSDIIKDAYVRKTEDYEGVCKLLDFFIAYRAFVRGEVTTMAALNWKKTEKEKLLKKARKYFQIAKECALKSVGTFKNANLYLVLGYVASGKTTVVNVLSDVTGAEIICTDEIRNEIFPLVFDYSKIDLKDPMSVDKIKTWIDSNDRDKINFQAVLNTLSELKNGEYRQIIDEYSYMIGKQKEMVYGVCLLRLKEYLLQEKDVVFDGTFSKRERRYKVYDIARKCGIKNVYIVQVMCRRDVVEGRLLLRKKNDSLKSYAREVEIYDIVKKEFDESRIESDDPIGINLRRIVYHTDGYEVEMYGEHDEIVDMILEKVIRVLRKRYD